MGRPKFKKWSRFEGVLIELLSRSGFEDVAGGRDNKIGGYQIDASGGSSGNFLVIECYSGTEEKAAKRRVDLRKKITELSGKIKLVTEGIKEKYSGSYKKVHFILALEDVEALRKDEKLADKQNIVIWDDKYVKLYDKLSRVTKKYTQFALLKELSSEEISFGPPEKDYTMTAFKVDLTQDFTEVYLLPMSAEKLLELAYVLRAETGKVVKEGDRLLRSYQRALSAKKIHEIAQFLKDGSAFKNNIIAIFEKPLRPEKLKVQGLSCDGSAALYNIHVPKIRCSVRVIDGQHRLFGYGEVDEEIRKKRNLLVVGLANSQEAEEIKTFVNINQTPTKVDSSILWDLYETILPNETEGRISRLVKELNIKGVFKDRIWIPGRKGSIKSATKINLGNFCDGLADRNLLANPEKLKKQKITLYAKGNIKYAHKTINGFFRIVRDSLPSGYGIWYEGYFLRNNGLNVALRVFDQMLQHFRTFNKKKYAIYLKDGLNDYVRSRGSDRIDVSKQLKRNTSEGSREEEATEIIRLINNHNPDFAKNYLEEHEVTVQDKHQAIGKIENSLRKLICFVSKNERDWWIKNVEKSIRDEAKKRAKLKALDYGKLVQHLEFPDYFAIILKNWGQFKPFLTKFWADKPDFEFVRKRSVDIRNKTQHYREDDLIPLEKDEINVYAQQFIKVTEKL